MALRPLEAGLGDGDRLAALHVWRGRGHGVEAVVDLAADQVRQHRAGTLVRDMQRLHVGLQLEHFERQMLGRACPRGTEADVAGIGAALLDDAFDGARDLLVVPDQQVGRDADQADRRKVLVGVVIHLREQRRRDRVAVDVRHDQRVAVARLVRHVVSSDHACGARPVLDQHRGFPHLAELLADDAREDVSAAARGKPDDDADRSARKALGPDHRCGQQRRRARRENPSLYHCALLDCALEMRRFAWWCRGPHAAIAVFLSQHARLARDPRCGAAFNRRRCRWHG